MNNINGAADSVNKLLGDNRAPLRQFTEQSLGEFSQMIRELRALAANLNVIVTRIERDPTGFIFGGKQGYTPKSCFVRDDLRRGRRPACGVLPDIKTPTDLYTLSPKSTFEPNLPNVYWQMAVETPVAPANLNTGRMANPADADLDRLLRDVGVDRSRAADGADADDQFVREHARSSPSAANRSACAPTTCCRPNCANSRRDLYGRRRS